MKLVVGSGILGLSLAYALKQRGEQVAVITNRAPHTGSLAAGALLATKGQMYARDAHFEFKLVAKQKYKTWLTEIIELYNSFSSKNLLLSDIFLSGDGLESHWDARASQKQERRISQPPEELLKRNFEKQDVSRRSDRELVFHNEAVVDAKKILKVLEDVMRHLGVVFYEADVVTFDWKNLNVLPKEIFLCTGAWTVRVLSALGLKAPPELAGSSHRYSVGSTVWWPPQSFEMQNFIYKEHHFQEKEKVTAVSLVDSSFTASTTVRTSSLDCLPQEHHQALEKFVFNSKKIATHAAQIEKIETGFRVAYGHRELFVGRLDQLLQGASVTVCAGAHKSGYLFAPVLHDILFNFAQ